MLKKIKFNLMLADKPCRSLKDLKENFHIEDILFNFNNGKLKNWLYSYNFKKEYDELSFIDENLSDKDKLSKIIKIFFNEEDFNFKQLEKDIDDYFKYIEENKKLEDKIKELENKNIELEKKLKKFEKEKEEQRRKEKEENQLKKLENNYEYIINSIVENKENYEFIKESIDKISINFMIAFSCNYNDLFNKLQNSQCIFGILAILANENTRNYFLNDKNIMKEISQIITHTISKEFTFYPYKSTATTIMINKFGLFGKDPEWYNYIWKKLKRYSNDTKWDFYIVENKKCLIIHLSDNAKITSFNDKTKEYSSDDINNKFLILDGITYKGQNLTNELIYMEI